MSVNALRLPNPTQQPVARAQRLLEDLQRRFQKRELTSHDDVRGVLYDALQTFFRHAAEPTFLGAKLQAHQPRRRTDYFDPIRKLADDLAVLYRESEALTEASSAAFNFQNLLLETLFGRLKRAGSTLIDLQIAQDKFNQAVIVAGDDFVNDSRIDPNATLVLTKADINPVGNLLTLRRTGNESAIDPSVVDIRVEPLQNYRYRLYEGQFYGLVGQAAPEGGSFHFVEQATGRAARQSLPQDLLRRFQSFFGSEQTSPSGQPMGGVGGSTNVRPVSLSQALVQARSQGTFGGFTKEQWELLAGHIHNATELGTIVGGETPEFRTALDPSKALVEAGASVEERRRGRLAILDGDPDTFWQIEYTRPIRGVAANLVNGNENFPERVGLISQVLQQEQRDFDALDLDIRLTIDLGRIQTINWVDLVPMLFEGVEHLEVLNFQTSADGNTYESVPPLRAGADGNRISRDSNATLDAQAVNAVLAASASVFTGRGLWVFAPRSARYLRLDLRQPVPVLVPYNLLALELSRTVRRRHSRSSSGHRRPSTQTTETRTVTLSYPETVQATTGSADPATQAQARGASRVDGRNGLDELAAGNVNMDTMREVRRDVREVALRTSGVGNLLGSGPVRGRTLVGADEITKQWFETRWDRQRYAIGIRDIGIWRYRFEETSEMVSIPFRSPLPIRDVSLEVDEVIPKQFLDGREIIGFIDYFVGLGDSQEWIPLAPVNSQVVRTLEGNRLSSVIHVNSGIPPAERAPGETYVDFDHDVDQIRFRAILRRPTDLPDAESFTPALKSYRMTWTVPGGGR
jgi:hypothetical protein